MDDKYNIAIERYKNGESIKTICKDLHLSNKLLGLNLIVYRFVDTVQQQDRLLFLKNIIYLSYITSVIVYVI